MNKNSNKVILSWALYDWANSVFATTVMAGFFPLFFGPYYASSLSSSDSTFYLGIGNSVASLFIAILAPILGAIADQGSKKKIFLFYFAIVGMLSTASLWLVPQGSWFSALFLYSIGALGFAGSNVFYDALLPSVSNSKNVNFVSSLGYALGYLGGGVLFLINVLMYTNPNYFNLSDQTTAIRMSFITVSIWWFLFSLPLFLNVKEPEASNQLSLYHLIKLGLKQLINTYHDIKRYKVVFLFLIAYWFYIDGVDTIIKMAVDFAQNLNFDKETLIKALLLVQFVAFPASLLYSWFSNQIGIKKAILIAIFAYIIICILGYFMTDAKHFYLLAIMIGLFQGGIQALSRSYYASIIPKEKSAEFFGFFNMLGKFAAILGPFILGLTVKLTGQHRYGILAIIPLFIIGAVLLQFVNRQEAVKQ